MRLRTRIVVAAGVLVVLALAGLGVVFDAGRKVKTVIA
jgi:hypothetical protein